MQGIVQSIEYLDSDIDSFRLWRQNMHACYSNNLSYREVQGETTKRNFKIYFINLKIALEISEKKPHISIISIHFLLLN